MLEKKTKNDLILIGALIGVLLIVGAALLLFRSQGDLVVVTVNGEAYATYPLSKDAEIDIVTGENGEHINRIVIKDGAVYMEYSNCPALSRDTCTKHKPISYDGQSIICRPHMVVVAISAEK